MFEFELTKVETISNPNISVNINIASELSTKMSQWELSNFAIQIVRNQLQKEGMTILYFCDVLEINPQIWFKDEKNNTGWNIVKHILNEDDLDYKKWVGLENQSPQLKPYDGFFASVQFKSKKGNSGNHLNRGDEMYVNYKGIERIYVSN